MGPGTLSQVFSWAAISFSIAAALSTAFALHFRTVSAEQKDAEIRKLQPRTLTDSQKATLQSRLSERIGTVAFIFRLMDGEGNDYAHELATVFRSSGWEVSSVAGNSLNDFPGYIVGAVSEEALLPLLAFVQQALIDSGIDCRYEDLKPGTLGGGLTQGVIWLIVGRRKQ